MNKQILALGFFDGVHLGHGALLRACRTLADELGCQAAVVTFSTHPEVLVAGSAPALLSTPADRQRLMTEQYHMDNVICLPFDRDMMNMPWVDFFMMLRQRYHAQGLVCGHDFRFGYRGMGTPARLRDACAEADIPCIVVPEQKIDGITISSTYIRQLLEAGDLAQAERFLGHRHILSGILQGNCLQPESGILLPRPGKYLCRILSAEMEGQTVLHIHENRAVELDRSAADRPVSLELWEYLGNTKNM